MKKTFLLMPLVALLVSHGHCETPAQAFEVVSITPCAPGTPEPPGEHMGMSRFIYPGGNLTVRATSVKYLTEWAFGLLPAQHSDGPAWLGEDRYDILAKASGNPTDEEMKRMTQKLLIDRFHLKFHREMKDVPVLVLSLGKTPPKLYPAKEGEAHNIKITPKTSEQKVVSYHTEATRYSFADLNLIFSRQLGRVIVNRTGMEGEYDFALDFTPDEERPNPLDPAHVMAALRDQLGLTVKAEKGPVDFFVIESVEKVAAGN